VEQITSHVNSLLDSWIGQKPNRSVSSLSRASGVGESTIRRLRNSNVLPSKDNLIKIIVTLSGEESLLLAYSKLKQDKSPLVELIENEYPYLVKSDENLSGYKKTNVPQDYLSHMICILSQVKQGISESELLLIFGARAKGALRQLFEMGLVQITEGKTVKYSGDKDLLIDSNVDILPELYRDFFKKTTQYNFQRIDMFGVNTEGYCQIMDVLIEASSKIAEIKKTHRGNIPMFTATVMDTLEAECPFQKKEEV